MSELLRPGRVTYPEVVSPHTWEQCFEFTVNCLLWAFEVRIRVGFFWDWWKAPTVHQDTDPLTPLFLASCEHQFASLLKAAHR